jgi:hypothetical protein
VKIYTLFYKIVKNAILQKPRPKYLCREGNNKENKKEDNNKKSSKIKRKYDIAYENMI